MLYVSYSTLVSIIDTRRNLPTGARAVPMALTVQERLARNLRPQAVPQEQSEPRQAEPCRRPCRLVPGTLIHEPRMDIIARSLPSDNSR